jgi:hypothetical protein
MAASSACERVRACVTCATLAGGRLHFAIQVDYGGGGRSGCRRRRCPGKVHLRHVDRGSSRCARVEEVVGQLAARSVPPPAAYSAAVEKVGGEVRGSSGRSSSRFGSNLPRISRHYAPCRCKYSRFHRRHATRQTPHVTRHTSHVVPCALPWRGRRSWSPARHRHTRCSGATPTQWNNSCVQARNIYGGCSGDGNRKPVWLQRQREEGRPTPLGLSSASLPLSLQVAGRRGREQGETQQLIGAVRWHEHCCGTVPVVVVAQKAQRHGGDRRACRRRC